MAHAINPSTQEAVSSRPTWSTEQFQDDRDKPFLGENKIKQKNPKRRSESSSVKIHDAVPKDPSKKIGAESCVVSTPKACLLLLRRISLWGVLSPTVMGPRPPLFSHSRFRLGPSVPSAHIEPGEAPPPSRGLAIPGLPLVFV